MSLSNIGVPGLILIVIIAHIIFGPKKLPEIGSAFGQTLSAFKKSANEMMSDNDTKKEGQDDTDVDENEKNE